MIQSNLSGGEQPQLVDTTAPEVQPAPAAPVAPAEGEQPQAPSGPPTQDDLKTAIGDLGSLTDEQIADLESGDPARIAAVLKIPEPAPKAEGETPKAGDEPAPAEVETPKAGDEKELHRISVRAIADKGQRVKMAEAMDLVRQGSSLEDALLQVLPGLAAKATPKAPVEGEPPAPAAPQPAPAPAPFVDPQVADLEKQIADLDKERAEAKAVFDYDKAENALLKMAKLNGELAFAQREADAREKEAVKFESLESQSREKVFEQFSELMTDPETGFADYVEAEIIIAEQKSDPILNSPDWPEKIAQKVYSRYFAARGAQPAQANAPAQQIPPAPAKPGVRFPGSPVGNASSPGNLTQEEILASWDTMTSEERDQILKAVDAKIDRS